MMPCRDIVLGKYWLREWLVACRRQAITWTNVEIYLTAVSQEVGMIQWAWEITAKSQRDQ